MTDVKLTPREIKLDGTDGVEYRFDFGINAACRVEEAFGESYVDAVERCRRDIAAGLMTSSRRFVRCLLTSHPGASLEDVGFILDAVGGPSTLALIFPSPIVQTVEAPVPVDPRENLVEAILGD